VQYSKYDTIEEKRLTCSRSQTASRVTVMDQLRHVGWSRGCLGLVGDNCQFVVDALEASEAVDVIRLHWLTVELGRLYSGQRVLHNLKSRRWMLAADVPYSICVGVVQSRQHNTVAASNVSSGLIYRSARMW